MLIRHLSRLVDRERGERKGEYNRVSFQKSRGGERGKEKKLQPLITNASTEQFSADNSRGNLHACNPPRSRYGPLIPLRLQRVVTSRRRVIEKGDTETVAGYLDAPRANFHSSYQQKRFDVFARACDSCAHEHEQDPRVGQLVVNRLSETRNSNYCRRYRRFRSRIETVRISARREFEFCDFWKRRRLFKIPKVKL